MLEHLKSQDSFTYDEIFVENVYDLSPQDVKGKTIIDVGANLGFFSLISINYGAKNTIALEAQPEIFKGLQANVTNCSKIKPLNFAVTDKLNSRVKIDNKGGASSIYSLTASREVNTITVWEIIKDIEDNDLVLKIDVEGSEYDILLSLPDEAFNKISTIFLEIHEQLHPKYKGYDILLNLLKKKGFSIQKNKQLYTYHKDAFGNTVSIPAPVGVFKCTKNKEEVLAFISTKGRYFTTLPLAIQSVIMQTHKPKKLFIYDDNLPKDRLDLREVEPYKQLFKLLMLKGIELYVIFGEGRGQHYGHQIANNSEFNLVWRLDDDEIAEPEVLEKLLKHMTSGVGAVAGAVIQEGGVDNQSKNKIEEIYHAPNMQWTKGDRIEEVEHLYSSFLYRTKIVNYNLDLSPVAHREETIFSHELFLAGYKLIVDNSIVTYHLRNPEGGIRSNNNQELFNHDEKIFFNKMKAWGIRAIVLNSGLGDHLCFLNILPELQNKYKHLIISCCYPEVFTLVPMNKITLLSIAQIGGASNENIYEWMIANNWRGTLLQAYRKLYLEE